MAVEWRLVGAHRAVRGRIVFTRKPMKVMTFLSFDQGFRLRAF
jgi:hypothetical protein